MSSSSFSSYQDPNYNPYENVVDCDYTEPIYKSSNITPSITNKYNCHDCSGNIILKKLHPPLCGKCPLKLNSIPRSPYRSLETPMSIYMSNLASLYVYQRPLLIYHNVNWNQSSDRAIPHIQPSIVNRNTSSLRGTRTGSKPGSISPGGEGVDIKHNSFNRYYLRLKGSNRLKCLNR